MPPQKPKPWTDVFPAVWWGYSAPQIMEKRYSNVYSSFADHWNYDDVSEVNNDPDREARKALPIFK